MSLSGTRGKEERGVEPHSDPEAEVTPTSGVLWSGGGDRSDRSSNLSVCSLKLGRRC